MKIKNIIKTLLLTLSIIGCQSAESQSNKLIIPKTNSMQAKIKTTKGDIIIELEYEKAPITVANFVSLAEGTMDNTAKPKGTPYYDGLKFHRVIENFMIQGGCPSGTGMGDPGYKFQDEFHPDLKHNKAGILSMANSGPATNGSQFFITHNETPWLDNKHTVFGCVVSGQDVVDAIEQDDVIESITIIREGSAKDFDANKVFNEGIAEAKKEEERKKIEQKKAMEKLIQGATVTESGLAYKVISKGSGSESPSPEQKVTINCIGKFTDGTIFWKTEDGKPLTHSASGFVPGFNQAVQMMVVGDKWEIILPSELAYGSRGQGPIPPDTPLVFEIELLEIQ
tara:strand:- start:5668 stop:6684 length:1017 start_codon:yes stop_codon:yes gene_type:complete